MKEKIGRFGKFLSGMVMPNIGAFIAWGFLTALFIEAGWFPNPDLAGIVTPMLNYLLPILIAGQGGYMVAGDRGRVIAAIAVVGCICGSDYTMLMGAMAMGPLAGLVIRTFDRKVEGHIPAGFEMLVHNFSIGILGLILAVLGYYIIGPLMTIILTVLTAGVDILVTHGLLPLVAVFVEPAKVLFLNNAINHGIFSPIGASQAAETGRSIMYMLEANPGPGLGVLLAYWFCSKDKQTRQSAPGAVIIHLLGGIHEIYFPYILMNPVIIVAPILGNICAIFFYTLTGAGLSGPASPGSIIAYMAMAPRDSILFVLLGVVIAAGVSFAGSAVILRFSTGKNLSEAQEQMQEMKAEARGIATAATQSTGPADPSKVHKIVFACDAGMGSSAMGATRFRNRIHSANPGLIVTNTSVDNIPADADIVVCQRVLADRARACAPNATLITIGNFLADPHLDNLFATLTSVAGEDVEPVVSATTPATKSAMNGVLRREGIRLGCTAADKYEAIQAAGNLLAQLGYVDESYTEAMIEREDLVTTYMGMGVAIPHGTSQKKGTVKKSGIVLLQYPQGVDFDDEKAYLVFGIAGVGDEHLDLLANVCNLLEDEDALEQLKTTGDLDKVRRHHRYHRQRREERQ